MKTPLGAMLLVPFLLCMAAGTPQHQNQQATPPPYVPGTSAAPSARPLEPQFPMKAPEDQSADPRDFQRNLAIARNKEIRQETEKLLELATELKRTIDTSVREDALSLQAIKTTSEIEKLAKKVRNKMKESYREGPKLGQTP